MWELPQGVSRQDGAMKEFSVSELLPMPLCEWVKACLDLKVLMRRSGALVDLPGGIVSVERRGRVSSGDTLH
jgi:hypothetical protein